MPAESLKLSNFNYQLPQQLIAQYPCAHREQSRLLVLDRATGRIKHRRFSDIVDYLSCGDCLVLNNTRVVSARMLGRRQRLSTGGGGRQEIFLLENLSQDTYRVLARPAKKLTKGSKIFFNHSVCASVLEDRGTAKIVKFNLNKGPRQDVWRKLGQVPLPPYIKRSLQDSDRQRYQTVYAARPGATAAPTAGLHFTRGLLRMIQAKGVEIVYLTLHINYGTFAPVKAEDITKHKMHKEYFILPKVSVRKITRTRTKGKKIFAVGTTSVRVLETCAREDAAGRSLLQESCGWTDLFIYPPYRFKAVDNLITNFHFPKSTLLMLVSAFSGKELLFQAYQEAITKKYRFFSYGDAMLIL